MADALVSPQTSWRYDESLSLLSEKSSIGEPQVHTAHPAAHSEHPSEHLSIYSMPAGEVQKT